MQGPVGASWFACTTGEEIVQPQPSFNTSPFHFLPGTGQMGSQVPILHTGFWGGRHHTSALPTFPCVNTGSITQVCKTHMLEGSFLQEEHLEQQYKEHLQATGFLLAVGKVKFLDFSMNSQGSV